MNEGLGELGIVLGSFSPLHRGHLDLIFKSKRENKKTIVAVCGFKGDKGEAVGIPLRVRFLEIKNTFEDDPLIKVIEMNDNEIGIAGYNDHWKQWLKALKEKLDENDDLDLNEDIDVIWSKAVFYTAEPAYEYELKNLGHKVKLLERGKVSNQMCATKIRNNPIKYWDFIAPNFKQYFQKKYLVIGTASEGKSNLIKDLSIYFDGDCTFEYGHEAMEGRKESKETPTDQHLKYKDFEKFLTAQYDRNSKGGSKKIKICDSDALTTLMYAKNYAEDDRYDLTLKDYEKLCEVARFLKYEKIFVVRPHNPFVQDGTRDELKSPMEEREKQFQDLMYVLGEHYNVNDYVTISGSYDELFEYVKQEIAWDLAKENEAQEMEV